MLFKDPQHFLDLIYIILHRQIFIDIKIMLKLIKIKIIFLSIPFEEVKVFKLLLIFTNQIVIIKLFIHIINIKFILIKFY